MSESEHIDQESRAQAIKIIHPGDVKKIWYVGKELQCATCGQKIVLGAKAHCSAQWIFTGNFNHVQIFCSCCGGTMKVSKQ